MCGMQTKHVTTYIKRGKIIQRSDDLMIDDAERINLDFLTERKKKIQEKQKSGEIVPAMKKEVATATTVSNDSLDQLDSNKEYATLQSRKAKADLEKKLIDTKTATLNYQILKGKHIPTELVRDVFMELGRSIMNNYKDSADSFLTEIAHKKGLNTVEHAELKGVLVDQINTAHHKAIEAAKKQISAIVVDFKKDQKQQNESDD